MNLTLQQALRYSTDGRKHEDFVDAALENPSSYTEPLVYADWLEDNAQEGLASNVRAAVKGGHFLKEELGRGYNPHYSTRVYRDAVSHRSGREIHSTFPAVEVTRTDTPEVMLSTYHPSTSTDDQGRQWVAAYRGNHSPEEAFRLLNSLEGVSGKAEALARLKLAHPHLFAESPQ